MTQNGIQFTIVSEPVFIAGVSKVTNSANTNASGYYNASKIESKGSSTAAVNAIDIDWNGAVLPNGSDIGGATSAITTTGELLNLINEMNKRIYTLTAAVIALSNK